MNSLKSNKKIKYFLLMNDSRFDGCISMKYISKCNEQLKNKLLLIFKYEDMRNPLKAILAVDQVLLVYQVIFF